MVSSSKEIFLLFILLLIVIAWFAVCMCVLCDFKSNQSFIRKRRIFWMYGNTFLFDLSEIEEMDSVTFSTDSEFKMCRKRLLTSSWKLMKTNTGRGVFIAMIKLYIDITLI